MKAREGARLGIGLGRAIGILGYRARDVHLALNVAPTISSDVCSTHYSLAPLETVACLGFISTQRTEVKLELANSQSPCASSQKSRMQKYETVVEKLEHEISQK